VRSERLPPRHSGDKFDPVGSGRVADLIGADIEEAAVRGTFQCSLAAVGVEFTLPPRPSSMGALVVDGVEVAVDVHQCDLMTLELNEFARTGMNLVGPAISTTPAIGASTRTRTANRITKS
jgi:hypothetical protein